MLGTIAMCMHIVADCRCDHYNSSAEDQLAIRTAEKLLKEIRPKSAKAEQKIRVLENCILLATKSKPNVERALERFADMASSEVSCDPS